MNNSEHLYYLGPEGTFTHQAALAVRQHLTHNEERDNTSNIELVPCTNAREILEHAQESWGVIAWENNVEGYVVPNLDMVIDAHNTAGFLRVRVDITFDAFVTARTWEEFDGNIDAILEQASTVHAHPHGLAQCTKFAHEYHLQPVAHDSNAQACRDVPDGAIALGPSICADIYPVHRIGSHIQDFDGAHTDFLAIAPREKVGAMFARARAYDDANFESVIAFIPLATGPGVLANLLDVLRDAGLNMTSFISRPIKGHDGTYSFIATLDAAPWEERFQRTFSQIAEHGDWVKTLAVYPRHERENPPVNEWMLPSGGVQIEGNFVSQDWQHDWRVRRELLW